MEAGSGIEPCSFVAIEGPGVRLHWGFVTRAANSKLAVKLCLDSDKWMNVPLDRTGLQINIYLTQYF